MDSKLRRRRPQRATTPVVIVPTQTRTEIERRNQIREAMHDAKAVTVRAQPRPKKSA